MEVCMDPQKQLSEIVQLLQELNQVDNKINMIESTLNNLKEKKMIIENTILDISKQISYEGSLLNYKIRSKKPRARFIYDEDFMLKHLPDNIKAIVVKESIKKREFDKIIKDGTLDPVFTAAYIKVHQDEPQLVIEKDE